MKTKFVFLTSPSPNTSRGMSRYNLYFCCTNLNQCCIIIDMDENEIKGIKRNEDGTFAVGKIGGPGRTPDTPQQKIIKKATKELIAEYKEALGESLPLIRPVLIAKALEGDIGAIKEIHDRVMDKAKQPTDVTTNGKDIPQPIINIQRDAIYTDDSVQQDS